MKQFTYKKKKYPLPMPTCLKYKKCNYFQSCEGFGQEKRFSKVVEATFFTCGLGQFRFTKDILNTKYNKCVLKKWWKDPED